MSRKVIVLSVNASWNIVNFRMDLIAALQQEGHDVVALAPEDEYSARLSSFGVDFHPLRIDKQGISPARDLRLMAEYRKALRRIRPDIFLGYTIKPNIYGSLVAHALGIPVINNVSGLGTAFIRKGPLTQIVSLLYRLAFRRSATIFFQNRDDRDLFVGKKIVRADQAQLLPGSGIDLGHFQPGEHKPAEDRFAFLFIGRLLWDKGIGEYVDAARLVRARHPNTSFRMLGFVDAPNRSAVARAQVEAWAREGIVDYLGAAEDVRPHIAAADCVVLPSYREGLPRALLEGAAMGKPLIATDVPGCRDIVEHGTNGLLCTVRDCNALADAMIEMRESNDARRRGMGARGRSLVERGFDRQIVIDRYLAAIERAVSIRGRRAATG
ncbi:MAG TPA: glycosyltransferase family 4 protein [Allosphingosinicella sp.]|nr:glycosyltransferase family 4 protein [Allosphingosinicella sp.]